MAAISPQDRYIRVDSINTRYRIQGAGSPVVLIHGIGISTSPPSQSITACGRSTW